MKYSVKIATVSAILIFSFYAGVIQTNQLSAFARHETSVEDRTATNSEQMEQREQQTTFSQEDSDKSNRIAEREKMAGSLNRGKQPIRFC